MQNTDPPKKSGTKSQNGNDKKLIKKKSIIGKSSGKTSGAGNCSNNGTIKNSAVSAHLDPVVRLNPINLREHVQAQSVKRKDPIGLVSTRQSIKKGGTINVGIFATKSEVMASKSEVMASKSEVIASKSESNSLPSTSAAMEVDGVQDNDNGNGVRKPRRASVHFAADVIDTEEKNKVLAVADVPLDKIKQENSRKHRSRKEKLVCRSESPSDIGIHTNDSSELSSISLSAPPTPPPVSDSIFPTSLPFLNVVKAEPSQPEPPPPVVVAVKSKPPPLITTAPPPPKPTKHIPPRNSQGPGRPPKYTQKRLNPGSTSSIPRTSPVFVSGGPVNKDPVRKKRVIEIVSPRKCRVDNYDTSSDPIFIRAATNKSFRLKNKFREKFSRKTNFDKLGHPYGRSAARFRQDSFTTAMDRMSYSPHKKEGKNESKYPTTFVRDLLWTLQEAEKELNMGKPQRGQHIPTNSQGGTGFSDSDPMPSTSATARRLAFSRRRVESEPVAGFDGMGTPSSPSGSQSFYHLRREIYFSPSPSYTAPVSTGRRRYSRRRHAKIHPPFDHTNCNFQGHFCDNAKVPGSQYCSKHLDQGPTSGYSHCRYVKDGRQCGQVFASYDPAITYCDEHSSIVAKSEHEKRNPTVKPDAAKNIILKINKTLSEGFFKTGIEPLDSSSPLVLHIAEENDIIQELPLGNYAGGMIEECDSEGERNMNTEKPDYDVLKNAGYYTTEEVIQIHIHKLKKLKCLLQREKELESLMRQWKLAYYRDSLEKLKQYGPRFTTNPYLIDRYSTELPKEYLDHQIRQYETSKAILQSGYRLDNPKSLLRLKTLRKIRDLEKITKATGQRQHDAADMFDSETDLDSDTGELRDRKESARYSGTKPLKCAYNEGYAIRACPSTPVVHSAFCLKHILSDPRQVQWVACKRRIGVDLQDVCKTPVHKILEKHGCPVHAPLVLTKHKPMKKSDEDFWVEDSEDNEEEEVSLEGECGILENLISDEWTELPHLEQELSKLSARGPLDITDTSDSEETDEEGILMGSMLSSSEETENVRPSQSL